MALSLALVLTACGAVLPVVNEEGRHLGVAESQAVSSSQGSIPSVVGTTPLLPAPQATSEPELYTVVAQDVPIRDLLFTMARDAEINVDVHPGVNGLISVNAINQTLPQILTRIARQADIRWSLDEAGNMVVEPDSAFWRNYIVNYANVSRSAQTQASVSTAIVSNVGGGGGDAAGGINNSVSTLTQEVNNTFWQSLEENLLSLLQEGNTANTGAPPIVANAESGTISVRATGRQHDEIAAFLNSVQTRSLYQVLIEATVVEVRLNDDFQQGVNWATIAGGRGDVLLRQNLLGTNIPSDLPINSPPGTPNNNVFNILSIDRSNSSDPITATMKMLAQFGELRVLSSPKIMALNNQAAMLRVVNNEVYFTIGVQPGVPATPTTAPTPPVYTSEVSTVPIGFVMSVTPQVGENDQVTLNIRPTISRIIGYVTDPNPILAQEGIINQIPTIQVREFESILKVSDGQIAILGGLMEDSLRNSTTGLPGLSRLPGLRNLFSYRNDVMEKTELIIFIRPVIVREASLSGDLREYQQFLPSNGVQGNSTVTPGQLPGFFSE